MLSLFKSKKSEQKNIGKQGEDYAASYLQRCGYTIITRNYRKRIGEVDIIARDDDTIVFVEVKTRRTHSFGSPFEAVDARKQRQLSKIAQQYLLSHDLTSSPARFDVIAITMTQNNRPEIELITNAFEFVE